MLKINTLTAMLEKKLVSAGLHAGTAHFLNILILSAAVFVLAVIANYTLRFIIKRIIKRWIDRSNNRYDDIFYDEGVFSKLSHIAPVIIILTLGMIPIKEYPLLTEFVKTAAHIYLLAVIAKTLVSFINALHEIYNIMPSSGNRPISGYIHFAKTIIITLGLLIALSIILKKDIGSLLAGITAFAAVLMFVFKDFILGLVAGIQISANDIVRIGDTIEMPKRDTEGKVIAISLSTVKVLNSNRTISTIPAYAIVTESFQNWRGLEISKGRRIKRTLFLDIRSISFGAESFIKKVSSDAHLSKIINSLPENVTADSQITNLGLFCAYITEYLKAHHQINRESAVIVRHTQPSENGLPLEILAYSLITDAAEHENMQNKLFEHLYATIGKFGLKIFQRPSGE